MKGRIDKILILISLWCVCIVLDLQFSFGFAGFFDVILLVLLISAILIFTGFIQLLTRRKLFLVKFGTILFLFCMTELIAVAEIATWQRNQTYKKADIIVENIKTFYKDNGYVPGKLNDLVPKYLPKVPKTKMGWFGTDFQYTKIYYSKLNYDNFTISFANHAFSICYKTEDQDWHCDD